ncbi:hypothetical protein SAMN03080615_02971 [Amphritea atlantica]|uniref:Tetratricopeptide repeat-containing protein n=1 Tax=Amphritea atlantica TaxID=355243 RepID=A0A1H9JFI1_9GAMM|nr:hypothetical protein [Amphritea atlantica]SEQ85586.1 hypothetical protein SAMN03080615_02971 [Amphritea atlantica]
MIRKRFLLIFFVMALTGCVQPALKSTNVASNELISSEVTAEKNLTHVYIMSPSPNNESYDLYFGTTKIARLDKGQAVHLKLFPNNAAYKLTIKDVLYGPSRDIQTVVKTTKPGKVSYWVIDSHYSYWKPVHPKIAPIDGQQGAQTLKNYTLVKPLATEATIAFAGISSIQEDRDACINGNQPDKCLKLQSELSANLIPAAVAEKVSQIQEQAEQQQKLDALEAKLPANVRRDKYMVQLSQFLKQQNYKAALDVFPKLEGLPIATDPSLKYFYGEALLKTNQPAKAMQKLYQYINEQGTGSTHYAQALEMINQAESKL